MKTMTPSTAVSPKHDVSVASKASAVSSGSVDESGANPMSDKGYMNAEGALTYSEVHCESSKAGKFEFGFMEKDTAETPVETPVHATGTYPIADGKETPNAKPTHAPGTLT